MTLCVCVCVCACADTIPGRQCMAACFYLLKQFEDVLIYLNSIKVRPPSPCSISSSVASHSQGAPLSTY